MLVGSISIYVILKVLNKKDPEDNQYRASTTSTRTRAATLRNKLYDSPTKWPILLNFAKILCLSALLTIGTIQPSVLSFVYYAVALGTVTWWGCNQEINRAFGFVIRFLLVFLAVHITILIAYQNPWPQKILPADSLAPR